MKPITRRTMMQGAAAMGLLGAPGLAAVRPGHAHRQTPGGPLSVKLAVKSAMVRGEASWTEKFRMLERLGYDGIDVDNTNRVPAEEFLRAHEATGFRIHGVVDPYHWQFRLSAADPDERRRGAAELERSIRDARMLGGSTVLLVPGRVTDAETENHDQVWERSIEEIRKLLPLAADLGIMILIENVGNGFCYDPEGGDDQTADRLAQYVDEINSPWVGVYFDIGNHVRYGKPENWIRTLGRRIAKMDIKDWAPGRWSGKITEGTVDWAAVRGAMGEIGYTGWTTAEVGGGDEARLIEIKGHMDEALGLG